MSHFYTQEEAQDLKLLVDLAVETLGGPEGYNKEAHQRFCDALAEYMTKDGIPDFDPGTSE
jgi:hypothetical protein